MAQVIRREKPIRGPPSNMKHLPLFLPPPGPPTPGDFLSNLGFSQAPPYLPGMLLLSLEYGVIWTVIIIITSPYCCPPFRHPRLTAVKGCNYPIGLRPQERIYHLILFICMKRTNPPTESHHPVCHILDMYRFICDAGKVILILMMEPMELY